MKNQRVLILDFNINISWNIITLKGLDKLLFYIYNIGMGYKRSYNIIEAFAIVRAAASECSNPRNDGFISWGVKQDLYQLKWQLDALLKDCPKFSLEEDWLKEQEQIKIIKILSDDI